RRCRYASSRQELGIIERGTDGREAGVIKIDLIGVAADLAEVKNSVDPFRWREKSEIIVAVAACEGVAARSAIELIVIVAAVNKDRSVVLAGDDLVAVTV